MTHAMAMRIMLLQAQVSTQAAGLHRRPEEDVCVAAIGAAVVTCQIMQQQQQVQGQTLTLTVSKCVCLPRQTGTRISTHWVAVPGIWQLHLASSAPRLVVSWAT
jgi:hypothetical protein